MANVAKNIDMFDLSVHSHELGLLENGLPLGHYVVPIVVHFKGSRGVGRNHSTIGIRCQLLLNLVDVFWRGAENWSSRKHVGSYASTLEGWSLASVGKTHLHLERT